MSSKLFLFEFEEVYAGISNVIIRDRSIGIYLVFREKKVLG